VKPAILRTPLRRTHAAIWTAVVDGNLRKADQLLKRAPAQYRAAVAVFTFLARLCSATKSA
jgi:hypothetical protein